MHFDDAARARIARGWLNSSLNQATYAAQHGISTRTLRDWICRYGGGRRSNAQLRAAIVASIEQLQNALAALDAEAAADSAAGPEEDQEVAERHAASEAPVTPPRATRVSPPAEPLASTPTPLDTERAVGARRPAAVRDNEAVRDVPGVAGAEVAAPDILAVAGGAGAAAAPSCPAAQPKPEHDRGPSHGNDANHVVDFEALRNRAAQLRAQRAASGMPRRKSFFDWDAE